jgi:hypothetical protein
MNETIFKWSFYKVSEMLFFQKVVLFFSQKEPVNSELFLMSFLVKEFSFFSYSLRSTNSTTAWGRIMLRSFYTKTYNCLSNYMNGERRNEWEIRLKSIIYSDRGLIAVQNSVIICCSSCFFIVEKFPSFSTCHEKMTFLLNEFLITQQPYELMSWNFVWQWGTQRGSTYKKIVWIGWGKQELLAKYSQNLNRTKKLQFTHMHIVSINGE